MNIDNVEDWLGIGVGGPGDEFTSSGPHGETSMQAQQKASQPKPSDDDSLLASVFGGGDDEELLTAEGGAASDAAQAAINFGNQAEEDIIMSEPLPGNPLLSNPGVFNPPAAAPSSSSEPADIVQNQAETSSFPTLSKTQMLLLGAAAIGIGYAVLSKKHR